MKIKKYIPLATWIAISLSLILTLYVKLGQEINYKYIFRIILFGSIGFVYTYSLNFYNLSKASFLFLAFSTFAGIFLFSNMPINSIGFDDLGILLFWLIFLTLGFIISLIYTGFLIYKRKKQS